MHALMCEVLVTCVSVCLQCHSLFTSRVVLHMLRSGRLLAVLRGGFSSRGRGRGRGGAGAGSGSAPSSSSRPCGLSQNYYYTNDDAVSYTHLTLPTNREV